MEYNRELIEKIMGRAHPEMCEQWNKDPVKFLNTLRKTLESFLPEDPSKDVGGACLCGYPGPGNPPCDKKHWGGIGCDGCTDLIPKTPALRREAQKFDLSRPIEELLQIIYKTKYCDITKKHIDFLVDCLNQKIIALRKAKEKSEPDLSQYKCPYCGGRLFKTIKREDVLFVGCREGCLGDVRIDKLKNMACYQEDWNENIGNNSTTGDKRGPAIDV